MQSQGWITNKEAAKTETEQVDLMASPDLNHADHYTSFSGYFRADDAECDAVFVL